MARTSLLSVQEFITKFRQLKKNNEPLEVLTAELFPKLAEKGYTKINPDATKEDIEAFNFETLNKTYAHYNKVKRKLRDQIEKLQGNEPKVVLLRKKTEAVLESIDGLVQRADSGRSSRGEDMLALVDGLVMDDDIDMDEDDDAAV